MDKFAHDIIVPDEQSTLEKKDQVAGMFNDIAERYDLLNRLLSGGIDLIWRKKALNELKSVHPAKVLDVATGTAEVAIMTYRQLHPQHITGIDISEGMLALGRKKVEEMKLTHAIDLTYGDSEQLQFPDNNFDAVTVAFGVRNFQNLLKGLQEMHRVLSPGGKLVVLEFSRPSGWGFKQLYAWYMKNAAPVAGKLLARNQQAYEYLNNSVQAFPEGEQFLQILRNAGFSNTYLKKLSFGICTIYCGSK
ncbi:MAG: bifunctional demethylmenaquinone methyltransferase/2-methoxy-6-polyprenyl-1,4-benzoquinol methylase UbiE [Sediminibacterium sp.]